MNSLVKVFSNFKEFYSEINGATLTGAIDVIVVEQPDGEFQCSPFHVRFGKLGVLRSREKVVDIEINGEPVNIHMKLGDSGEAFFVEECREEDVEALPDNLATSPIPTGNHFPEKFQKGQDDHLMQQNNDQDNKIDDDIQLSIPLPRRNSIDFSKEIVKDNEKELNFENQLCDYSHRRHTDNTLERRNLDDKVKEYTTHKIRQEWAEHEEIFQFDAIAKDKDWSNSTQTQGNLNSVTIPTIDTTSHDDTLVAFDANTNTKDVVPATAATLDLLVDPNNLCNSNSNDNDNSNNKNDENKTKKRRRKRSQMKKKNSQRKSSTSSVSSNTALEGGTQLKDDKQFDDADAISMTISNLSTNSSSLTDENTPKSGELPTTSLITAADTGNDSAISEAVDNAIVTPVSNNRIPDLDIHFFSDTEVTSSGGNGPCGISRGAGRPSTPIQSDSELEISMRDKDTDSDLMSNSASWKWGELPTPELNEKSDNQAAQAQRNSMLSSMFNFMKKNNKIRKQVSDGGVYLSDIDVESMDPEMIALYFPNSTLSKQTTVDVSVNATQVDDDGESGNGTSLPNSPSSLEGQKSLDSDYDDGKVLDGKYLDFVAMSLCGLRDKGDPSDEEFERHAIKYQDVCENPSIFSSPNLVVRLNGKFYSWAAACPIVMTIITFQKPLNNNVIDQLMANSKSQGEIDGTVAKTEIENEGVSRETARIDTTPTSTQAKRSWWYWRRPQNPVETQTTKGNELECKNDANEGEQSGVATQTSRSHSPDLTYNTNSKTEPTLNTENTSAMLENLEDITQNSSKSDYTKSSKQEHYKKSLRLSSAAIKNLNLKEGINEIEFSVTTAYQGTTRCKCYLFHWKHNDKIVISDIDGTITKSDVLGHLLPMVGKDWAQLGVAQLFSKIEQNGYKLLYLSARAIGQSRATREYLRSIRQGDVKLPDGPLLLNPTSLISAFHREVIERKPEQFKIACLSDVRELFPNKDPFYAGYGNRINDVWAYRAVGIPIKRIFTINTKGELKHELTQTFQSSMTYIVDQLFPPTKPDEMAAIEFSYFNYWRDPIQDLDFQLQISPTTNANGMTGGHGNPSNTTQITSTTLPLRQLDTAALTTVQKSLATIPE